MESERKSEHDISWYRAGQKNIFEKIGLTQKERKTVEKFECG